MVAAVLCELFALRISDYVSTTPKPPRPYQLFPWLKIDVIKKNEKKLIENRSYVYTGRFTMRHIQPGIRPQELLSLIILDTYTTILEIHGSIIFKWHLKANCKNRTCHALLKQHEIEISNLKAAIFDYEVVNAKFYSSSDKLNRMLQTSQSLKVKRGLGYTEGSINAHIDFVKVIMFFNRHNSYKDYNASYCEDYSIKVKLKKDERFNVEAKIEYEFDTETN
ncbi:hypothetical protein Syun_003858 [Stephania yunnanensis]|uniref:Uncharacterized protein n=1 Tax=Stephania yunnanensis TaxID=152371 RepID=A0AAP0Q4B5_9MAGN